MAGPEQPAEASGSEDKKGLQNGIRGLERLQLVQGAPLEEAMEGIRGVLIPKVRRSIERKIINRQNKIEAVLSALASATDVDQLRRLVEDDKKIEEITTMLGEQSSIAEKESLGHIDHRPFQEKIQAVEDVQRNLAQQLRSGTSFDTLSEIGKLKDVLIPRLEAFPPSSKTDTGDPRESMADELITAAMHDPGMMQKVAERLPKETQKALERLKTGQKESKELFTFDDVKTLEDLDRLLSQARTSELQLRGDRETLWYKSRDVADLIRRRVAEFEADKGKKGTYPENKIRAFLSVFVNNDARGALCRALVAGGLLSARGESKPTSPERTVPLLRGQKEEELGSSTTEKLASIREGELLKQILADVAATPTIGREEGKKIIAVNGADVANDIRKLVQDFQKEEFSKLSKEIQTKEILSAIATLTSHTRLQADLRAAFLEMGLLEKSERPSQDALSLQERRRLAFRHSEERQGGSAAYHLEPEGIDPYMKGGKAKVPEVSSAISTLGTRREMSQLPITPAAPLAPKSVEVQKTPEVRQAEALNEYFGKIESGTDFLRKIVDMSHSAALRENVELAGLERLSGELSQHVIGFFDMVDTWEREKKGRKEIMESGENFIASVKIPSGCQGAFRTIMFFAVRHKLGPVVETLKASPTGKSSEAKTSPSLSSQDILTHYKASKAAAQGAPEGAPTGEALKPTPTPEGESESFLARIRDRGARLFHSTRKSMPETPPVVPTTTPTVEVAPAPSPVVESAPVSSEERIKALTFEEVLKLAPENLQKVLQHTNIDIISAALTDMSPQYIEYVRQSLSEEDRVHFDRLRSLELLNTQVVIDAARRKIVEVAQGLLKEEKVSSAAPATPPEEPTAPTSRVESVISEEISEGWTPERIEALPFEGLADLSDDDLRLVVKSARTNAIGWGMLAQGLSENFRARIRKFVDYPPSFDDGTTIKTTPERINEGRKATVDFAKQKLLEALQRKNPPQS